MNITIDWEFINTPWHKEQQYPLLRSARNSGKNNEHSIIMSTKWKKLLAVYLGIQSLSSIVC